MTNTSMTNTIINYMNKKEENWDSLEHALPTYMPPTPPVSILCPARKDWGSPRITNHVSFTQTNQRRNFMPDQEDIQSRKKRNREIYGQIKYHYLCECFEERVLPQLRSTVMDTLCVISDDPEEEDDCHFDSSLDVGSIDDNIDSAEDPLEDTISNGEIPEPLQEQSDNAAITGIPPDGMGSGWTECGKRYSLQRAKLLITHMAEDPFTKALGSGMTEQGRRYSRRVANRQNGAN
ncbi:unnamed protein product [Cylindrotheca closterium]|uniref:Uncharacterized protein n=1 Tax=Cylindrotheca closterium TaxID=2856 RepID=A0AAD2JGM7_9STRA|nr:unnamed protein product [Cylindrotheca closterium]